MNLPPANGRSWLYLYRLFAKTRKNSLIIRCLRVWPNRLRKWKNITNRFSANLSKDRFTLVRKWTLESSARQWTFGGHRWVKAQVSYVIRHNATTVVKFIKKNPYIYQYISSKWKYWFYSLLIEITCLVFADTIDFFVDDHMRNCLWCYGTRSIFKHRMHWWWPNEWLAALCLVLSLPFFWVHNAPTHGLTCIIKDTWHMLPVFIKYLMHNIKS